MKNVSIEISNLTHVEQLVNMLDKIGITRPPDNPYWALGGKGDLSSEDINRLAELHGENDGTEKVYNVSHS